MTRQSTQDDVSRLEGELSDEKKRLETSHKRATAPALYWLEPVSGIAPAQIHVPSGRRPLDEATVDGIADDIKRNGFHSAILVREAKDGECEQAWVLLDGAHRLEAAKRAKLKNIPIFEAPADADASAIEHAANLFRKELSEAERALAMAEYKKSWDAHKARLAAEKAEADAAHEKELAALDEKFGKKIGWHKRRLENENIGSPGAEKPGRPQGFATQAAALLGQSKSQTNKDVATGNEIAAKLESGEANTPDEALEQIRAMRVAPAEPKPPAKIYLAAIRDDDQPPPVARELARLRSAWDAAPPDIRRQFLSEIRNTDEAKQVQQ